MRRAMVLPLLLASVAAVPSAEAAYDTIDRSFCGWEWGDNGWCKSNHFRVALYCNDICDTRIYVNGVLVASGRTSPSVGIGYTIFGEGFFLVEWVSCDPWGNGCGPWGERVVKLDLWNPEARIPYPPPGPLGTPAVVVGPSVVQVQGEDRQSGIVSMVLRINGQVARTWTYPPDTWALITENYNWACNITPGVPSVLNTFELTVRDSAGWTRSVARGIERVGCS